MDSIVTHKSEVSSEEFSIYKWFVHSLVVTGTGHKFFICSWKLRTQFEEEILDILSLLKNSPIRSFKGEPYIKSAGLASKTSLRLVLRPRSTVGIYSGHLVNSKSDTKYKDSKNRLLNLFKESESLRIKWLLTGIELGDRKSSQLLQKLKTAITSDISENLSKTLRLEKLPDPIKNILVVSDAN
ncbi:transposon Ty3-I Gag-Pol polyprotein [Trichonephila clavipes]|uniref:Transposon Ty3-I Gag-Pol polyprotein n=1 Tax=Trichonephila clavipes TaxID=2585209 RepID=A0A8X6VI41_TRICX|nr:transposon Ty3-I Gag-Pol polyprotein [Trichonephila clavipes]